MHVNIKGKEFDEHVHDKINKKWKVCTHKGKTEKLSKHYYGVIITFMKGVLRIKNDNKGFYSFDVREYEVKRLSKEVMKDIKNNEAIGVTDASVMNE